MKTKVLNKRVYFDTLGCSKNTVDSEVLMKQFEQHGWGVAQNAEEALGGLVVINTCGFINDAKEESVNTILSWTQERKAGRIAGLFVMGCLVERYKNDLSAEFRDEVDGFFGVDDVQAILESSGVDYRNELLGQRVLTTPSHYAYLKISEGCDRSCSFCAIPMIRGKHHSKRMEDIISEARFLAAQGVKELMLIAQDITWYGLDLYKKRMLPQLVEKLVQVQGIEWIRLHYAYPAGFPVELLDVMNSSEKICPYLDIPFQHISDPILKSMKRGHTSQQTRDFIQRIREKVPGVALRTTLIVGYPGETEADFQALCRFVETSRFERLGVFSYSHEEDTAAYLLEDDVPDEVKQQRVSEIMELQEGISLDINRQRIGKTYRAIIDRREGDFWVGRTAFDSPEVDNELLIPAVQDLQAGNFYQVKITEAMPFDLYGEVINI